MAHLIRFLIKENCYYQYIHNVLKTKDNTDILSILSKLFPQHYIFSTFTWCRDPSIQWHIINKKWLNIVKEIDKQRTQNSKIGKNLVF